MAEATGSSPPEPTREVDDPVDTEQSALGLWEDEAAMKKILDENQGCAEEKDEHGNTLLHFAASNQANEAVVRLVLKENSGAAAETHEQ